MLVSKAGILSLGMTYDLQSVSNLSGIISKFACVEKLAFSGNGDPR